MANLLPSLNCDRILLMDGAMGTELRDLQPDECRELRNLTRPDSIRAIHQAYAAAGAEVLLTNTFQANPTRLRHHNLLERGPEICRAAVELARSAAPGRFVLGDIGPMTEESGGMSFPQFEPLLQVAEWLAGVDALLLETCSDCSALDAVAWLHERLPNPPILLSLTFRLDRRGQIRSWDDRSPEDFAAAAAEKHVAALGVNCGAEQTVAHIAETVRRMRRATNLPIFARPNAGTPTQIDGRWDYPLGPEALARSLPELLDAGVCMVGGCCGTTPAHIAALRARIAG